MGKRGVAEAGVGEHCLERGILTHGQVAVETTKFEFLDVRLDQPPKQDATYDAAINNTAHAHAQPDNGG